MPLARNINVTPDARKNISTDHFSAGHMMYIDAPSAKRLRAAMNARKRAATKFFGCSGRFASARAPMMRTASGSSNTSGLSSS